MFGRYRALPTNPARLGLSDPTSSVADMTNKEMSMPAPEEPMRIDCDDCAVRGPGCRDCVVSVLLGTPETLLADERAALDVLAAAGMAPRLRLVPVRRDGRSGVA